jgi:adenosylcobinamide kinase/adenosylcobinamide-phosphate guanylyltransferase
MPSVAHLTFVIGGARSGKSRYAESLIARLPPPWIYVATAQAGDKEMAVLVDCLTLWLSNQMLADGALEEEMTRVEKALLSATAPKVVVSNEVGSGIVPDHPLGRRFRDAQGILNQRIAALAGRVVLVVAGLPLAIKGDLEKTS